MSIEPLKNLTDLKHRNKAAGRHWFSRGAVEQFQSVNETGLLHGHFFVNSIASYDGSREYNVNFGARAGSVTTLRRGLASLQEAREWLAQNYERFRDVCDCGECEPGEQCCVRYPLGENSAAYLCYRGVCRENEFRRENQDSRSAPGYWDLVRG